MPEFDTKNLFSRIETEFAKHLQNSSAEEFALSEKTSGELSGLARELERKRQESELTSQELEQLRLIDSWMERIANFNERVLRSVKNPEYEENLYDIKNSRVIETRSSGEEKPIIIPKISQQQASQIISGLNDQFEEKVMKKLGHDDHQVAIPREKYEGGFSLGKSDEQAGSSAGRSLNEYLSEIKHEIPSVPFADEDSKMDLSKLSSKDK